MQVAGLSKIVTTVKKYITKFATKIVSQKRDLF